MLLGASDKPDTVAVAQALAVAALQRDSTVLTAYNVLGLGADIAGKKLAADRIFRYAHRLSRRDLATELWLIEANVARDDVRGALEHFDAAMSTSSRGWATLSPILLAALDDPQLVVPIADLAARKRWWSSGFQQLVAARATPLPNATRFFMRLNAVGSRPSEVSMQTLVTRLVAAHMPENAALLDALVVGARHAGVRDGGFDQQRGLAPFRWELTENDKATAERARRPDVPDNSALNFSVDGGFATVIARQLVALRPGAYTLSADSYAEEADGGWDLTWSVLCENAGNTAASLQWPASTKGWITHRSRFVVPSDCPFQWIKLSAEGSRDAIRLIGWIDNVAVAPVR